MHRCDEEQHCKDGTDEQNCSMVVPDIGYNKHLTPFPIKGDTIFYVNVSYEIKRILFIDENENFMRLIYNIQKDWHDRMLTFQKEPYNFGLFTSRHLQCPQINKPAKLIKRNKLQSV